MSKVLAKIRRMSINQLRALGVLAKSKNGIVESVETSKNVKLKGKSLGGVFSSLSRQMIGGQPLVLPMGRGLKGRGIRWKLNQNLISLKDLKAAVEEVLESYE